MQVSICRIKPNKSVRTVSWIDYDHDGDIDLILLGLVPRKDKTTAPL